MKKSSSSMKSDYQKYLQSAHWQQRRRDFISDMGNICEKCDIPRWLAQIAYQQDLNVHHLSYANLGHEEDCDLEALCRRCHEIETFGRSEFRAPKQAKCDICDCLHYDPYGGLCEVCRSIMSLSEPIEYRLESFIPNGGKIIWKVLVSKISWWLQMRNIQTEDILAVLVETHRKYREMQEQIANDPDGIPF